MIHSLNEKLPRLLDVTGTELDEHFGILRAFQNPAMLVLHFSGLIQAPSPRTQDQIFGVLSKDPFPFTFTSAMGDETGRVALQVTTLLHNGVHCDSQWLVFEI